MRYSDQLETHVKNVSSELTLEEHKQLRQHAQAKGKPVSTLLREIILKAISPKPRKTMAE